MPALTLPIDRDDDVKSDPLRTFLIPPSGESEVEREKRLAREHSAKLVSDAIDEEIGRVRSAGKRKVLKILLAGQSESGKSTALKNIQICHSLRQFRTERSSWRPVIYLNIVRSIRLILRAIEDSDGMAAPRTHASRQSLRNSASHISSRTLLASPTTTVGVHDDADTEESEPPSSPTGTLTERSPSLPPSARPQLTLEHYGLLDRLSPLADVERTLLHRLSCKGETEATHRSRALSTHELAVMAHSGWKNATSFLSSSSSSQSSLAEREREEAFKRELDEDEDVARQLRDLRGDVETLLNDDVLRKQSGVKKLRVREMSGFFLDSLDRVTVIGYEPTDDDVVKARLRTLGVTEHSFTVTSQLAVPCEWRVFDVGGIRSQREFWVPYFDDMNAIIFVVPISAFDQVLAEDRNLNRLEDSILLWREICSNKLLQESSLILFLNKCDILREKLESGVKFSKWVRTYVEKTADERGGSEFECVTNYMRRKFEAIHRSNSKGARLFYCHLTSLTDVKNTRTVLGTVIDFIMRQHLKGALMI